MTTVLVTGASRGVGAEVARLLIHLGHDVVGVHRKVTPQSTALENELGEKFTLVRHDLSQEAQRAALVATLQEQGDKLAGVVLNAGVSEHRSFVDGGEQDDPIRRQISIDLESPLLTLRSLLQDNLLGDQCSVVFTSSNLARHGLEGKVGYSAAKGGIEAAVRALARELGPIGIRVNAVAPGLLRTDMTADVGEDGFTAYVQSVPLRRVGTAADVAPMMAFLLDAGAAYITGQVIDIDGGWGC